MVIRESLVAEAFVRLDINEITYQRFRAVIDDVFGKVDSTEEPSIGSLGNIAIFPSRIVPEDRILAWSNLCYKCGRTYSPLTRCKDGEFCQRAFKVIEIKDDPEFDVGIRGAE